MTWLYWISTICAMIPCMQFCNIWEKWGKMCHLIIYMESLWVVVHRTLLTVPRPRHMYIQS